MRPGPSPRVVIVDIRRLERRGRARGMIVAHNTRATLSFYSSVIPQSNYCRSKHTTNPCRPGTVAGPSVRDGKVSQCLSSVNLLVPAKSQYNIDHTMGRPSTRYSSWPMYSSTPPACQFAVRTVCTHVCMYVQYKQRQAGCLCCVNWEGSAHDMPAGYDLATSLQSSIGGPTLVNLRIRTFTSKLQRGQNDHARPLFSCTVQPSPDSCSRVATSQPP